MEGVGVLRLHEGGIDQDLAARFEHAVKLKGVAKRVAHVLHDGLGDDRVERIVQERQPEHVPGHVRGGETKQVVLDYVRVALGGVAGAAIKDEAFAGVLAYESPREVAVAVGGYGRL